MLNLDEFSENVSDGGLIFHFFLPNLLFLLPRDVFVIIFDSFSPVIVVEVEVFLPVGLDLGIDVLYLFFEVAGLYSLI